jgi:DNA-binding transcriptional MerR regulator
MSASEVIRAFSAEHMAIITGLSARQIRYWDQTDFFTPSFVLSSAGDVIRMYSFRDAVSLRTLAVLKARHNVSLQHLRKIAKKLSEYSDAPFAELKLYVHDRKVYFDEPETGRTRGVLSAQYELLPIIDVMNDVKRAVADLATRRECDYGRSARRRNISHNAEVIAGTRIPVRAIRHFLEDGFTFDAILREYPTLTREDVQAVASGALKAA